MNRKLLPLLLIFISFKGYAQIGFQEDIIDIFGDISTTSFSVTDIDNDGDLDIICASISEDLVRFFRKVPGGYSPGFITNIDTPSSVYAADIDNDGDKDVVISSNFDHKVVWLENTNGTGTFGPQQVITTDTLRPWDVHVADVDGDGDMDVLSASYDDHKIAWYENTDGNGTFGSQQIIASNTLRARSVHAADIDNDGDLDVLSASSSDDKVAWYENTDGQGTFVSHIVTTSHNTVASAFPIDMDNDGDLDILASSNGGGELKLAWYENTNGQGNFGNEKLIALSDVFPAHAADIDGDGDIDVVTPKYWYENIDGLGNFGVPQPTGGNYATNASVIQAIDIDGDMDMDILYPKNLGSYRITIYENIGANRNEINGIVSLDSDSNGCDISDATVPNIIVTTTHANTGNSLGSLTTANGIYQLFPTEGSYTSEITTNLPSYFTITPSTANSNFTGLGNVDTIDFCIQPTSTVNDLTVSVYPSFDEPRPGFDTTYQIVYKNTGTTQLSGNVVFEFDDSKLQFLSATETVSSQTVNSLTFDYTNLNPFETRTIDLEFNVFAPPITNIDDQLNFTTTISPVSGDNTAGDNVFALQQKVIGSYDPNDIQVLEGDEVSIDNVDKYLHYIIRFQNTGTASAINVSIENELDVDLDWGSLQLESLSHTGSLEIVDGNMLKFVFNNIYLPDSTTDEPNSHGFITYKIKPKSNATVGDIITNTADIFFDFNPAIVTNTVTTEITGPLSVREFDVNTISVYPNPVKNILTIEATQVIKTITLYDLKGSIVKMVLPKNIASTIKLDIEDLSKGIYFLKIQTDSGVHTKKIIKS